MVARNFSGGAAATTLNGGISSGASSIVLTDGSTYPTANFTIVIDRGQVGEEKVFITSRSTNTLTVSSRGYDGTTASAHSSGATVEHCGTALDFQETNDHVNGTGTVHAGATVAPAALIIPGATSPAQTAEGSAVWDTDDNLLSIGTASARKTMVDTDSSQTLTNKTLTAPTIADFTNAQHDHGDADDGGALAVTFKGVKAYKSGAQTINSGADTAITWNLEAFDTNSFHDNSSNTSRLTVPSGLGGKYLVDCVVSMTAGASGDATLNIYKNGDNLTFLATDAQPFRSGAALYCSIQTVLDLSVGDYIEAYMNQSSGSSKSTGSTWQVNHFGMTYLGA